MKPDSMTKFDYLFLGALIFDLFIVIAGWDWILAMGREQLVRGGAEPEILEILPEYTATFMAIRFAALFAIWLSISIFRVGFMRYILALWMAHGIYSVVVELIDPIMNWLFRGASILVLLMSLAAVFFVFKPDAGAWLRREI